jgi:hypothetical protein
MDDEKCTCQAPRWCGATRSDVIAEVNDDGHLELFEALGDWPRAVIDVPQLARAAYAAMRGAMQ